MEAIIKGTIMAKEITPWEVDGKTGNSYTYDLYQKGQLELVRVKCKEKEHGAIKEGSNVEVLVDVDAKASYGNASIKCIQKAIKQAS